MRISAAAIALGMLACQGADELPVPPTPSPPALFVDHAIGTMRVPHAVSRAAAGRPPVRPQLPDAIRTLTRFALVTVRVPGGANGVATVSAELARTNEDSERGLMYRTSMGADRGMLFDLGKRQAHTFWMHDTCIPLDMLFIDDDGLVVGVLENVPPMNDDHRSVPCPSSHVLETNAGWSRRARSPGRYARPLAGRVNASRHSRTNA